MNGSTYQQQFLIHNHHGRKEEDRKEGSEEDCQEDSEEGSEEDCQEGSKEAHRS